MTYLTTAVALAAAVEPFALLLAVVVKLTSGSFVTAGSLDDKDLGAARAADTDGGNCKACLTDSRSLILAGLRGGNGELSLGGRGGGGLSGEAEEEDRRSDGKRGGGGSGPAIE